MYTERQHGLTYRIGCGPCLALVAATRPAGLGARRPPRRPTQFRMTVMTPTGITVNVAMHRVSLQCCEVTVKGRPVQVP